MKTDLLATTALVYADHPLFDERFVTYERMLPGEYTFSAYVRVPEGGWQQVRKSLTVAADGVLRVPIPAEADGLHFAQVERAH